jgi:PAS domain S-box-containing protein
MRMATALIYWIIIALWLAVLATVARAYVRNPKTFGVTRLLLLVVSIDTLRNIIENLYFGFYFGSQYGLFPGSVADVLGSPNLLIVPKLLNVLAACAVLALLLFRWLPLASAERLQAEETLQAKTRQLTQEADERRRVIETALDAFVQIDRHGEILQWNSQAETMFGASRTEAIGARLEDLLGLEAGCKEHLDRIIHGMDVGGLRTQAKVRGHNGEELEVEFSVSLSERQGDHVFNIFARDLTEKVAAENQLRQSQKMQAVGQLTGGIAHDFNNLLTVIIGAADTLAAELAGRPHLVEIAGMIDEAANRGADLTRQLLAFARRQPLQPGNLDVNVLVTDTERLLKPTLGERISIKTMLSENPWRAFVDSAQLTSAVLNLALNARDAMPNGGVLTFETRNVSVDDDYAKHQDDMDAGDYVELSVSDNGAGIRPDIIDSIFEPFFTTKAAGEGTGLGLSMVYGFVKQSRGHIKVYSEEGVGTTFKLYLPRAFGVIDETSGKPEPAGGGDELVLVVEDDALVRNHVVGQVNGLGYRTIVAANADEALAVLESQEVDLLFTDVMMPGAMNGPDLVRKARHTRPDIRVLYTSGYAENGIVHNGQLDAGMLLLPKPYGRADLARMLRAALHGAVA